MSLRPKLPISTARLRHTPAFIETLIAIHTRPAPDFTSPTAKGVIALAQNEGLIEDTPASASASPKKPYQLTERGRVYLQMLLDTPLPTVSTTFADPRTL